MERKIRVCDFCGCLLDNLYKVINGKNEIPIFFSLELVGNMCRLKADICEDCIKKIIDNGEVLRIINEVDKNQEA